MSQCETSITHNTFLFFPLLFSFFTKKKFSLFSLKISPFFAVTILRFKKDCIRPVRKVVGEEWSLSGSVLIDGNMKKFVKILDIKEGGGYGYGLPSIMLMKASKRTEKSF